VIFIFTLLCRGVSVSGHSMEPTLLDKEYLVISRLFYEPKQGDIVVVQSPKYKEGKEAIIKRIIATEGQTIRINFKTWQVWVDGVLLQEDYIKRDSAFSMDCEDLFPDANSEAVVTVADNCIFVMGDNRNGSLDSRSQQIGQIPTEYIMGRVLFRLTPLNRFGKVK
jgi:signal peptidase I